jgi:hypothetical protein
MSSTVLILGTALEYFNESVINPELPPGKFPNKR